MWDRSASAGGQLEQPSEVKSSTTAKGAGAAGATGAAALAEPAQESRATHAAQRANRFMPRYYERQASLGRGIARAGALRYEAQAWARRPSAMRSCDMARNCATSVARSRSGCPNSDPSFLLDRLSTP